MNRPKFEIGEEVILQSVDYPQCNGTYVIENIFFYEDETFCYELNFTMEGENSTWWDESALRKKHPPARDDNGEVVSYTQMIDNLKGVSVS